MNRIPDYKRNLPLLLGEYALVTGAIALPIWIFNYLVVGSLNLFHGLAGALMIALPFIFLPPRRRILALIPVWLIPIFYLVNLWYILFSWDMIPASSYLLFGNFDSGLVLAAGDMAKPKQILIFLPAALLSFLYFHHFFRNAETVRFGTLTRIIISAITLGCFAASEYVSHVTFSPQQPFFYRYIPVKYARYPFLLNVYRETGPVTFTGVSLIPGIISSIIQSDSERNEYSFSDDEIITAQKFLSLHSSLEAQTPDMSHIFVVNEHKNLIFIVVESLNSWVVNYEYNGREIMPVLSGIIRGEGCVSNLNTLCQTHHGVSSDGQFIYVTGLYAASNAATVSHFLDNHLPSLPKLFAPRTSFEVISENPNLWNHKKSNVVYGYDFLVDNTYHKARKDKTGLDEAVFNTALEVMDTVSKPFFGFVTTMSMHLPYSDPNVNIPDWIESQNGISAQMKSYLAMTNHFDTSLGKFIAGLRRSGIYDNSVIVIASDHTAPVDGSGYPAGYSNIVFAVLGAGTTLHSETPMGQVDVYPTLCQIMNRFTPGSYNGLGLSIFNPALTGAVDKNAEIHGTALSASLDSMLRLSTDAANILLKADYPHNSAFR